MSDAPVPTVTSSEIAAALRGLGIEPGGLAQFHSSLKSFGRVEGGAEAVVEACLEALGPGGTVMMPSFNHGQREAFDSDRCIFDVRKTRSVNGAITEAFRNRAGVKRSIHPSHPYVAHGPLAEWLTRDHLYLDCFDARSPLGKLCALNGWIVMLGCGMTACTAVHVAQTIYGVPCIGQRQNPWPVRLQPANDLITAYTVTWRDGKCPFEFQKLEDLLVARGQMRETRVGHARIQAFRGADCIAAGMELCLSHCPTCPVRPQKLPNG
ncbi:MAG: AAC(3) family N-acetyltransferase [Planctomycetota bacterium]|nr:AAC(3) family N-acetyltransferase [Planctomycetota bacterium]